MLIDGGAVAGPPDSCQYVFIYILLFYCCWQSCAKLPLLIVAHLPILLGLKIHINDIGEANDRDLR